MKPLHEREHKIIELVPSDDFIINETETETNRDIETKSEDSFQTTKYRMWDCLHHLKYSFSCGYCLGKYCEQCFQTRMAYCAEEGCSITLCPRCTRKGPDGKTYCPDHVPQIDWEKIKSAAGSVFTLLLFVLFLLWLFANVG